MPGRRERAEAAVEAEEMRRFAVRLDRGILQIETELLRDVHVLWIEARLRELSEASPPRLERVLARAIEQAEEREGLDALEARVPGLIWR